MQVALKNHKIANLTLGEPDKRSLDRPAYDSEHGFSGGSWWYGNMRRGLNAVPFEPDRRIRSLKK